MSNIRSTGTASKITSATDAVSTSVKFLTAGISGVMAWIVVHPSNTLSVRMSLASLQPGYKPVSFFKFASQNIAKNGFASLYNGLSAGVTRQIFYATSRLGLFEVYRDKLLDIRGKIGFAERLVAGVGSGACSAMISCPAELSLVRCANDASLPAHQRRNYKHVGDALVRILKEEGPLSFWRGCLPFVQRCMLVGALQVGCFDQYKEMYQDYAGLMRGTYSNVFAASMTSGLIYSLITMPFETTKNRMQFQKPLPDGTLPYTSVRQTMASVATTDGFFALWRGFLPYYGRCGGHTVCMFIFVEFLRAQYLRF